MKTDDTNLFFESFYDTIGGHFFYRGARASPKLLLFVIYKFFSVKNNRLFACLFTQLKGRMGEPRPHPKGVDEEGNKNEKCAIYFSLV